MIHLPCLRSRWPLLVLSLAFLGAACDPEGGEAPEQPAQPVVEATPPAPPPVAPLSAEDRAAALSVALVPSPIEMQKALERAGVATRLAAQVKQRKHKVDDPDPDRVAVRTGVVLADLLLTAGTGNAADLGAQVAEVRSGMVALGAGPEALRTLEELQARIENGSLTQGALVAELDEISGTRLPELEAQLGERALPLIRAGSWLEGASLVSGAIIESGNYAAAGDLLRHPAVVDYFQTYAAQTATPTELQTQLRATLEVLDRTSALPTLGEAEVKEIHESTSALLALL